MGIVGQDGLFTGSDDRKWEGEYVVLRLIERAGENVLATQRAKASGPGDILYTLEMFRQQFATCVGLAPDTAMSRADAVVLLKYLERDKKAVIVDQDVCGSVLVTDQAAYPY